MNRIQKLATTLAGILLVVLVLVALAPQAARGVAAALVQITNTTANPVPNRDVDNGSGRHPSRLWHRHQQHRLRTAEC